MSECAYRREGICRCPAHICAFKGGPVEPEEEEDDA